MCYLREFKIFVAAYEEGSFSEAAKRENATQSGVSQYIKRIETVLGARLFVRNHKSVSPTPAGDTYYRHCVEILRSHEDAIAELSAYKGTDGEVTVGITPWISANIMPAIIDAFKSEHPNVKLTIVEAEEEILLGQIRKEELGLAFVPLHDGLENGAARDVTILSMSDGVIISALNGGAGNGAVSPSRLGNLRMIIPPRDRSMRRTIDRYLDGYGVRLSKTLEMSSIQGTINLVRASRWSAILPSIALCSDADREGLMIRPMSSPPRFGIGIVRAQRPTTAAMECFQRMIEAETARISLNSIALLPAEQFLVDAGGRGQRADPREHATPQ